jgi:hypothetical protein
VLTSLARIIPLKTQNSKPKTPNSMIRLGE